MSIFLSSSSSLLPFSNPSPHLPSPSLAVTSHPFPSPSPHSSLHSSPPLPLTLPLLFPSSSPHSSSPLSLLFPSPSPRSFPSLDSPSFLDTLWYTLLFPSQLGQGNSTVVSPHLSMSLTDDREILCKFPLRIFFFYLHTMKGGNIIVLIFPFFVMTVFSSLWTGKKSLT